MSLPYGLLGLLTYQDSTGYDLTKTFEASLNNFWHAQSAQIYRELDRMEQKGWVISRSVIQENRPNKRVYTVTDDGRAALQEWLGISTPEFERPHNAMLMRVFFGTEDPETTLALLKTCRDMCIAGLEELQKRIPQIINSYSAMIPNGEKRRLYWEMTLQCGIAQTKAMAEWAQECIEKIEGESTT